MTKNKDRLYLTIIFVMLVFSIILLINNVNTPIYKQLEKNINLEVNKYKYIPEEKEEDIISFLTEKVKSQNVPVSAMDYVFQNCFETMNEQNKFFLFSLYYQNYNKYIDRYNRALDDVVYQNYLYELNYKNDINDMIVINKIEDITLRTILSELRLNNIKIIMNDVYPQLYFDYETFLNRFNTILPKDYIDFCKLEFEGSKSILNPGHVEIDMNKIIWYLNSYKEYIETTNNEELKKSAINIFQKALGLYLGTSEMGQYYTDSDNYKVSDTFTNSYEKYVKEHSDNDLSNLINDILVLIKEKSNKGENILVDIDSMIYNYLNDKGWIVK